MDDHPPIEPPWFVGGSGYWFPTRVGVGWLGSVVGCFELDGWPVAAVAVEACVVELMRVIASRGKVMRRPG